MTNKMFKNTIHHLKTGMYFINSIRLYKMKDAWQKSYYNIRSIHIVGDIVHIKTQIYSAIDRNKVILKDSSVHRKNIQNIRLDRIYGYVPFDKKSVAIEEEQIELRHYKEDEGIR